VHTRLLQVGAAGDDAPGDRLGLEERFAYILIGYRQ
jgi:hypothetical protein